MTDPDPITELLAERRVERVAANPGFVNARLKQASDNVESAKLLRASNARAAVTIAYDAMRFAVDAHMQANGLRVANAPGAHRASVTYARTRMADLLEERDLDDYEALRTVRNRIEYPDSGTRSGVTTAEAEEIAACSERIVVATTRWWVRHSAAQPPPKP
jgi:hypothetical protein